MSELWHSAKGTSWSKKDHKYIKKEQGRYYYDKRSAAYKAGRKVGDVIGNALDIFRSKAAKRSEKAIKKDMTESYKKYVKTFSQKAIDEGKSLLISALEKS